MMLSKKSNHWILSSVISIGIYFSIICQRTKAGFIERHLETLRLDVEENSAILVDSQYDGQNQTELSFLTGVKGVKLKEMRKLARLAGLEHPEKITEFEDGVCYEDDCLEAANEFYTSMDLTKDPCFEWRKFACEWRTLSSKTSLDQMSSLALKAENQVVEILYDNNIKTPAMQSAQEYFQACIKWFQDFNKMSHLKQYLRTLGGWPLLEGSTLDGDWTEIFVKTSILASEAITPFLFNFVAAPMEDGKILLKLDTGSAHLEIETKEILDILQLLRMNSTSISLSNEIAQIREMQQCMRVLSLSKFHSTQDSDPTVMSLGNLQDKLLENIPNFKTDLVAVLQKMFDGTSLVLSKEMDVLVNFDYFSQYISTIQNAEQNALVNILFLELVLILLGDTTDELETTRLSKYNRALNPPRHPSYRRCITETSDIFSYALSVEYIERYYKTGTEDKIQEIVRHLKVGFLTTLRDIKWLQPTSKQIFENRIKRIETLVGYPKWISSDSSRLSQYYSGLILTGKTSKDGDYLKYRIIALSWYNGKLWELKLNETRMDGWMKSNNFAGYTIVEYFPDLHQLRIPAGALQNPLYENNFPGFMNFGGIGSVVAREMARIIDSKGIFLQGNTTALSLDQDSFKSYMQWSQQLQTEWEMGNEHDLNLNDKIIHVLAYHITVAGYREFLKSIKADKGEEELTLPGLQDIQPEKLLHIKYSNVLCEDPLIKRSRADLGRHHSLSRYGLSAVTQTTQFALLFGCENNYQVNNAFNFVF